MSGAQIVRSAAMDVEIAVLSKPGGREVNEDACGYWTSDEFCCQVLSDGAGGHGCGDIASKVVVRTVLQRFREAPGAAPQTVLTLLAQANATVLKEQRAHADQADMRATAAVLLLDLHNSSAIWGHLGDSRVYCFRDGRIVSQTRDHSVVQSMVDAGFLDPGSVRTNPKRSVLTAAMGNAEECNPAVPDAPTALTGEEAFLMCSDGFWEYVDEQCMEEQLGRAPGPEAWLNALEAELKRKARPRHDNYSAIAVWLSSQTTIFL
ncbi:MAG: PP2C family serine/threonine-protein phosphatase [Burkholderiales bacterium]